MASFCKRRSTHWVRLLQKLALPSEWVWFQARMLTAVSWAIVFLEHICSLSPDSRRVHLACIGGTLNPALCVLETEKKFSILFISFDSWDARFHSIECIDETGELTSQNLGAHIARRNFLICVFLEDMVLKYLEGFPRVFVFFLPIFPTLKQIQNWGYSPGEEIRLLSTTLRTYFSK